MKTETSTEKRVRKSGQRKNTRNKENQLISMAMDLAEEKLKNGTASSQLITHFLKLGTVREQLENEKLRSDLEVAKAKILDIQSRQDIKELYEKAINAMNIYGGTTNRDQEEGDDDE